MSSVVSMRQLLEAGVHFGHQTKRSNPKMKRYIFTARNGIHVIDLQKTIRLIADAYQYAKNTVESGGKVLLIGTKKQAQSTIKEEAERGGMPFVNQRWLGGTLTNFKTILYSVRRLRQLEKMKSEPIFEKLPSKEQASLNREYNRLDHYLRGIAKMNALPQAVFIVDPSKEEIAFKEARKLNIPIIAMVDTNCDPTGVDFPIPANDDAIRSIKLIASLIADACLVGNANLVGAVAEGAKGEDASAEDVDIQETSERFAEKLKIEENFITEVAKLELSEEEVDELSNASADDSKSVAEESNDDQENMPDNHRLDTADIDEVIEEDQKIS